MLSNIFLHHVLDQWFETEVRPRMAGPCTLVRFADDFVMTFKNHHDAKRVMEVLGKRLGRFGLALHPDKTRFIDFRPQRQVGPLQRAPQTPYTAQPTGRPSLRRAQPSSPVKNRMREICPSGSVGGEGGNILAYPAAPTLAASHGFCTGMAQCAEFIIGPAKG